MSAQYAGTPTGTGPALPTYLSDAEARQQDETAHERALILDYSKATNMSTPDLLALAMGLASNPRARIAAMDELNGRYMRAQNLPGALV